MFYKILAILAYPFVSLLYPTKIIGKDNMPKGKAIVLCNHYSMADVVVIADRIFAKGMHMLAKEELFKNRIVAWFLKKCGGIPINREGIDIKALKEVIGLLQKDKKVVIFPEGTRNKSGSEQMLPLKHGSAMFAIKTKSPVVPMLFYRKPRLFRKNYLIIGKPYELDEFYGYRGADLNEKSTEVIKTKFDELRIELNEIVEGKGK